MAKQGFGGQWIDLLKVTKAIDSTGVERELTPEMLRAIVANFNAARLEAPITIGHPKKGDPAFGWIPELRFEGNTVQMLTEDTDDEFEDMIRMGRFKTRSAGILIDHPTLKTPTIDHVAFLGAEPPAVKGLRNIQFSETRDGESFTVETIINLQEKKMEEKDLDQLPESFWDKFKAKLGVAGKVPAVQLNEGGNPAPQGTPAHQNHGLGTPQPAVLMLSETSVKSMLAEAAAEATKSAKAEFAEQLKTRDEKIAALTISVDANSASGRRSEIASFVDGLHGSWKHQLKRAGVVEFMEALSVADAADKTPAVVCFSEGENGEKKETKVSRLDWARTLLSELPPLIQFGEKFANLKAGPEADVLVRPDVEKSISSIMNLKEDGGDE